MVKWLKRIFSLLFFLSLSLGAFYVLVVMIDEDLEFGDSFALYGGGEEVGYPSAGYLISYDSNSSFKSCGFSALSNNIGITAGHCVDNSAKISLGKGSFNLNPSSNINVIRAIQKEGWVSKQERVNDFAILIFNAPEGYFTDFSSVEKPEIGCKYRVIAYGKTEKDDLNSLERKRKSALMCITEIQGNIFFMTSKEKAGICFGDSGSPIYLDGSNKVVGITASIVNNSSKNPTSPCDFNNVAIGVRADLNESLISENSLIAKDELLSMSVSTGLDNELNIVVAEDSFLSSLGFSKINTDFTQVIFYVSGFLIVIAIIIGLYSYANRKE